VGLSGWVREEFLSLSEWVSSSEYDVGMRMVYDDAREGVEGRGGRKCSW
jgi:hypothetical protein